MSKVFINGELTDVGHGADEIIQLRRELASRDAEIATLREQVKGRAKAQVSGACLLERREEDRQQILSLREQVAMLRKALKPYAVEDKRNRHLCPPNFAEEALATTEPKP